jgi:hypothetical protein
MTLSLLTLSKPLFKKNSIRSMRKQFGWTMAENRARVLNFFSDDELISVISSTKL